ncbi:MAG TPA: NUDIX domain-containing protein [Candidatus Saccharimonadales bacterium]|nr:NUDIX domain-containing protein [Candidatus Saccharimonadales bacterium]
MTTNEVQQIIDQYLRLFPGEAKDLDELQKRLEIDEVFNNRASFSGHGAGGAIVLSPDRTKILLIHHRILKKWFQPGGHWDPEDVDPWSVARREAEEETGVKIATLLPIAENSHIPIDINTHHIPANVKKHEPAHLHHEFRYVFLAASEDLSPQEAEVHEAQWVLLDSKSPKLRSVKAIVQKLQSLNLI